jgi:hypothetical protein
VKVILGDDAFWHTVVVPLMLAVGKGFTVTTAEPVAGLEHSVELASFTETTA